jgi:hypothetical protein
METNKTRKRLLGMLLACVLSNGAFSQSLRIATFEVNIERAQEGLLIPAAIDLDQVTFLADSLLSLDLVEGTNHINVPFQVSSHDRRMLHWLAGAKGGAKKQVYELSRRSPTHFSSVTAVKKNGALTISAGQKNLLRYNYGIVYPPAGIDSAFKRSGFIHPLWTLNGKELTRIQAPDHYHHYGIWNPWTHVLFEGDTVDFWNLKSRQGTVRFSRFGNINEGPVFSEFSALHEHVVFKKDRWEKVALNEVQTVRVYQPGDGYFLVDITIELNCATASPFKILQYRYAGLGWRATEKWKQNNSEVLTSESKTRKDADGTTAKWFYVQGALDDQYGGAAMLGYPTNYNFPEPLRIWPENSNGGEMFAMFAPTKNRDWNLEPGRTYTLRYRFVVFNDHFSKAKAESAWSYYAQPPLVTIRK